MPASVFATRTQEFNDPKNPLFNAKQGMNGQTAKEKYEAQIADWKANPNRQYKGMSLESSRAAIQSNIARVEEILRQNDEFRATPEGGIAIRLIELNQPFGNDINNRVGGGYVTAENVPAIDNILKQIGTENEATQAIAITLARRYGINDLSQIGERPSSAGGANEWYNKNTGQALPRTVATYDDGNATYFFGLNKAANGGLTFDQPQSPRARAGGVLKDLAPLIGLAAFLIPGIGAEIGAAILGSSAATVAAAVGLSEVAVATAVGAATISSGMTALQGGSVEDVIKAGLSAGAASGVNFAAGGGVAGAAAGSAVGTAIQGGDLSQVATNAFAAAVGAGVQGVMTENPDAGKIIGSAARTYIATGGDLDKTLLNTAATAIGTLDSPAKTEQQAQAAVTPASDAAAQEIAARNIESVTQSDAASQQEAADYQEKLNQYNIDKAIYEQTYGPVTDQPPAAAPPAETAPAVATTNATTGLESQTITAKAPVISPAVTGTDLINQVAAQPVTTVDPKALERVIVQGQKDTANVANVAPVQTEVTSPTSDTTRPLDPVTVTATTEKAPEPGFEEYKPLPEEKVSDVVTDVVTTPTELAPVTVAPPDEPVVEEEPPKKEEPPKEEPPKKPEKIYPTVTGVPPKRPARPGKQSIIAGASPARLLADALAAYRPSGAIEGEESGKERQNVWNEKSLRLKDALGL